jgi:hypothetical protein
MFVQTTKQPRYTSQRTLTEITINPPVKMFTLLLLNKLQFHVEYFKRYEQRINLAL